VLDRDRTASVSGGGLLEVSPVREVLYKSLGVWPEPQQAVANVFRFNLFHLNQLFNFYIPSYGTRFFMPQHPGLCFAARFFTTQKIFSHCEI
jgi:hypothetical protein